MRIGKETLALSAALALLAVMNGCARDMIGVREGADSVALVDASQVAGCQARGKITVSVIAKLGFISRSVADVDANLAQLARNGAVDAGGDTIVKGERQDIGKRTFAIYKCRP